MRLLRCFPTKALTDLHSTRKLGILPLHNHAYSSSAVHRPLLCQVSRPTPANILRLHSQLGTMSSITAAEWKDVSSALLDLITMIKRADGPNWDVAFQMSPQYLDVRAPKVATSLCTC